MMQENKNKQAMRKDVLQELSNNELVATNAGSEHAVFYWIGYALSSLTNMSSAQAEALAMSLH